MADIRVEYVDHMGSDTSVVNAARVSFAKDASNYTEQQNERLIKFLARERHELPFAHTAITLRCSAPIPQRTHCFKSKVGFVENEESRRYIDSRPELFIPDFREAVQDKKQGSGGIHPENEYWREQYLFSTHEAISTYIAMIDAGICPEQARYVLPQGVMVNWIWTGSLLAYARFYGLRHKPDTQLETQVVANKVGEVMLKLFPASWTALTT